MVERFAQNYDKYRAYAYSICKCHDLKNDLCQDAYIKIDTLLTKNPQKEISDGFIYKTIQSVFIDRVRKAKPAYLEEIYTEPQITDQTTLKERLEIQEILSNLFYFDREILMLTQRESLRSVAKKIGISPASVLKYKREAQQKVKMLWEDLKAA